jgi:hypothetical protein
MMAGSVLTITNATFAFELAGKRAQDRAFNVFNSGAIQIAAGSTLAQLWTATANSGSRGNLAFENQASGVIAHSGAMVFRLQTSGPTNALLSIRNYGLWRVSGTSASVKRLTTSQYGAHILVPTFTNAATGTLQGGGAADALEFDEEVADGTRRMTIWNDGRIAPGAGSQGGALASVGALRLRDIDLTLAGTNGTVALDFGGAGAGQYDRLILEAGATDPTGAGTLDLSGGGTLQLYKVNGYAPGSAFAVDLITAGSVSGVFAKVKLDSDVFTGDELTITNVGKYALNYTSAAVHLRFIAQRASGTVMSVQ